MIYLLSLKKYATVFLKTLAFFAVFLLLYLFIIMASLKFTGNSSILLESLKNYATMLLYSIPLMVIVSTFVYYANHVAVNEKWFIVKLIPITALFNAVFLFLFFFINIEFLPPMQAEKIYATQTIIEGHITPVGNYKITLFSGASNQSVKGILLFNNAYFITHYKTNTNDITLHSDNFIGESQIFSKYSAFSIPMLESVVRLPESGISAFILSHYVGYVNKLKSMFEATFVANGILPSIIAILLLTIGFCSLLTGVALFFNDKKLYIMNTFTLLVLSAGMFFVYPHFLGLINLIKFGIKDGFLMIFIPSLLVTILAALLSYGLVLLRVTLVKRAAGQ